MVTIATGCQVTWDSFPAACELEGGVKLVMRVGARVIRRLR